MRDVTIAPFSPEFTDQAAALFLAEFTQLRSRVPASDAFVRPAHRGHGAATALLNAALGEYAHSGFTGCSVDFESFNPEARAFWLRSFTPRASRSSATRKPSRHQPPDHTAASFEPVIHNGPGGPDSIHW